MLFENDAYLRRTIARVTDSTEEGIVLDRTVFYPTGGGQPGDTGFLELDGGERIRIVDTRHASHDSERIIHVPEVPVELDLGCTVKAEIDWDRRYRHMRMHTCLHLLSSIVDAPVTGCSISQTKGRLDFDLPEPTIDRESITAQLADLVQSNATVIAHSLSIRDSQDLAGLVKTRAVSPPVIDGSVRVVDIIGIDLQACGGTHVARIGEIGAVMCVKIEKKSRHNRRVTIEFC